MVKRKDSRVGDLAEEHPQAYQRRGLNNKVVTRGRVLEWIGATSTLSFVPWLGMAAQPQKDEEKKGKEEKESKQSPGHKPSPKSKESPGQKPSEEQPKSKESAGQKPSEGQQPQSEKQQESQRSVEQEKESSGCLGTIVYCLCFLTGLSMLLVWMV